MKHAMSSMVLAIILGLIAFIIIILISFGFLGGIMDTLDNNTESIVQDCGEDVLNCEFGGVYEQESEFFGRYWSYYS